jgi:hypothetical protein
MNFGKTIVTAVVGAGIVLAFSMVSASADIVCNDMGVCWHTHNPYDYPPEAHVTVHENEWRWGAGVVCHCCLDRRSIFLLNHF